MNGENYSDIYIGDKETISVDYKKTLATKPPGVTVVSGVWSIVHYGGADDANPNAMLVNGSAGSVSGTIVSISVAPTVAGAMYWPRCRATLSDGEVVTLPESGYGSLSTVG